MFNDIIVNILRKNKLLCHDEDFFFNIESKNIYMYRGEVQNIYWNKFTNGCLGVPCVHFHIKIIEMKHYFTKIFKSDTSSDGMNEKVDHWLDYFEKFHRRSILLCLQNHLIIPY